MDLILDRNALEAAAEGTPEVARAMKAAVQPAIPVIVLGEYRFGIAGSRYRTSCENWLVKYLSTYKVLQVDEDRAVEYAVLRGQTQGCGQVNPIKRHLDRAVCLLYSYPILSRDRHFDQIPGLSRISW